MSLDFSILKNKKINIKKLSDFGFKKNNKFYFYCTNLSDGQFELKIKISEQGDLKTELIDTLSNDLYTLHLIEGVSGEFVGKIRAEYEKILSSIIDNCFDNNIFKTTSAQKIIEFIWEKYNAPAEYLWEKTPNNAIFRRKDNNKWFAVILTISADKLGFKENNRIEILDLKMKSEEKNNIVDNIKYFEGYHMNKKTWFTLCLNNPVPIEEIYSKIEKSYELARN